MDIQDTLLKPEEILADIVRAEDPSAKDHVMATMANILIDDQPYLAAQAAQLLLPALLDAYNNKLRRSDVGLNTFVLIEAETPVELVIRLLERADSHTRLVIAIRDAELFPAQLTDRMITAGDDDITKMFTDYYTYS
jgi:hypothetical protein